MIIQCKKCRTKYRFDESLIDGEGSWVRCTRCNNIFFQENPSEEKIIFPPDTLEEGSRRDAESDHGEFTGELSEVTIEKIETAIGEEENGFTGNKKELGSFEEPVREEIPEGLEGDTADEDNVVKKAKGDRSRALIYIVIAVVALVVISQLLFPQESKEVFNKISSMISGSKVVGDKRVPGEAIKASDDQVFFVDMKEHTVSNWIVGNLLVIEGVAVNKNIHSVSNIKVRAKILDTSGHVLVQEEVYGGTVLTEEELRNLTKDEIKGELSNLWGRNFDNRDIQQDGKLPFMIVFVNPPENAQEYLIDLAGVKSGEEKK